MKSKIHGFTLIELLIVVAIIAILAAIAVPNFLEAQVRAKVSRAKSDQRSLATSIEAYYVDWNAYPNDLAMLLVGHTMTPYCIAHNGMAPTNPPLGEHFCLEELLYPLSTPVSYFTNSFLRDPLNSLEGQILYQSGQNSNHVVKYYVVDGGSGPYVPDSKSNPVFFYLSMPSDAIAYPFMSLLAGGGLGSLPPPYDTMTVDEVARLVTNRWMLVSAGPDGLLSFDQFSDALTGLVGQLADCTLPRFNAIYDPSNGTVSRGDVVRSGAGVGISGQ